MQDPNYFYSVYTFYFFTYTLRTPLYNTFNYDTFSKI